MSEAKVILDNYNNQAGRLFLEAKLDLKENGYGVGDVIVDKYGEEYRITALHPKSFTYRGKSDLYVSFLGVKRLKATGDFGTYSHRLIL